MLKVLSGGLFYILMSVTFSAVGYSGEISNLNLACSDFPPSKIKNSTDGKPGYDIEIIRAALARVGIKVNVEFFPWKRALFLAKEGKMDGLCSCSYVQSREAYFKYSDEVGYLRIGLFYPPGYGEDPAENLKSS